MVAGLSVYSLKQHALYYFSNTENWQLALSLYVWEALGSGGDCSDYESML